MGRIAKAVSRKQFYDAIIETLEKNEVDYKHLYYKKLRGNYKDDFECIVNAFLKHCLINVVPTKDFKVSGINFADIVMDGGIFSNEEYTNINGTYMAWCCANENSNGTDYCIGMNIKVIHFVLYIDNNNKWRVYIPKDESSWCSKCKAIHHRDVINESRKIVSEECNCCIDGKWRCNCKTDNDRNNTIINCVSVREDVINRISVEGVVEETEDIEETTTEEYKPIPVLKGTHYEDLLQYFNDNIKFRDKYEKEYYEEQIEEDDFDGILSVVWEYDGVIPFNEIKAKFDCENIFGKIHNVNDTDIYLCGAGGDWEVPIYFVLYIGVDHKLHAYMPEEGNAYCHTCNYAIGSCECESEQHRYEGDFSDCECLEEGYYISHGIKYLSNDEVAYENAIKALVFEEHCTCEGECHLKVSEDTIKMMNDAKTKRKQKEEEEHRKTQEYIRNKGYIFNNPLIGVFNPAEGIKKHLATKYTDEELACHEVNGDEMLAGLFGSACEQIQKATGVYNGDPYDPTGELAKAKHLRNQIKVMKGSTLCDIKNWVKANAKIIKGYEEDAEKIYDKVNFLSKIYFLSKNRDWFPFNEIGRTFDIENLMMDRKYLEGDTEIFLCFAGDDDTTYCFALFMGEDGNLHGFMPKSGVITNEMDSNEAFKEIMERLSV